MLYNTYAVWYCLCLEVHMNCGTFKEFEISGIGPSYLDHVLMADVASLSASPDPVLPGGSVVAGLQAGTHFARPGTAAAIGTLVGNDPAGIAFRDGVKQAGIDASHVLTVRQGRT